MLIMLLDNINLLNLWITCLDLSETTDDKIYQN